ncbi:MAG: helix-turn-helix protein [Oscillospiraceae bacterium]|nr:helix-turn-helix protein [Oscillospiraceae bacterium]
MAFNKLIDTSNPTEKKFLSANDVAAVLGISRSSAYRIIRRLNCDLEKSGKITVSGKISARYFYENIYL